MNKAKFLLVIFVLSAFSANINSAENSLKRLSPILKYIPAAILLAIGTRMMNEDTGSIGVKLFEGSSDEKMYKREGDASILFYGGMANFVNTLISQRKNFSKKEIINYLISVISVIAGKYMKDNPRAIRFAGDGSDNLPASYKAIDRQYDYSSSEDAAKKGRKTGTVLGIGLGMLFSNAYLDIAKLFE